MKNSTFQPMRKMSAADVLATLQETHRQYGVLDGEVDPDVELALRSTVEEWREADDLIEWRALGRAMNKEFEVNFSDKEWRDVLEPERKKTLRHVCDLLAEKAYRPEIRQISVFGIECLSAGAFLTLRSALRNSGVPVEELRPSTPLEPYLKNHCAAMMSALSKMAPHKLPLVEIEYSKCNRASWHLMGTGFLSLILAFLINLFTETQVLNWVAGIALFSGLLGIFTSNRFAPATLSFSGLQTFRDLVESLIQPPENEHCMTLV